MAEPLCALGEARGLLVGAMCHPRLLAEPAYAAALGREFAATVAGTEMKFRALAPAQGRFDFAEAETLLAFADAHGMRVRGHTLVWHHPSSLPEWFKARTWSRDEALGVMRGHIAGAAGHFRGRLIAWDVVNEAIDDEAGLRDTPWSRAIGPDYLDHAFRFAREADPDVPLYYNDYAIELPGPKSDAVYALLAGMRERGVPVDGVGFQGHVKLEEAPARDAFAANMQRFADLGLAVQVTEADVWLKGEPDEAALERQAEAYAAMVGACLDVGACDAFVLWGFTDRHSWVPGFTKGEYGHALIFDESYRPKPAYEAMARVLEG